ncbi:MAG: FecR domain-containing protein [Sinobacteraceae bacterium]|nr:FecR domain-containing protein [Nevskiaceae bacterium]MCP5339293.1 FecR domain-containing protein [Nevskiaceae bacterium]MCP5359357.1 FecR domain-containing protein [Nevskiaceae bacterium]MCP5470795.1 FecR domain-containing protein [Nevskiaceae bacterium]
MSQQSDGGLDRDGDAAELRALREGLRANPLSTEALQRIRAATEAEWRATVAVTPPRRRWLPVAVAAGVAGVAALLGLAFLGRGPDVGASEVLARLVRSEPPGMVEARGWGRSVALPTGSRLVAGRSYRVRGQALLVLENGGNLRLAAGSELEVLGRDVVELERGEIYVDIPPGMHAAAAFVVRTAAGEFHHVGTQFALAVFDGGETRLRVREGSVRWQAEQGDSTVEAGTEVIVSRDRRTTRRPIHPSDPQWDWTAATPPYFEVENRPLGEFLQWVARESGRELVLADELTRQQVATIRMHGSARGLTPMQALSAVMAATPLRFELPEGEIRVSFVGEPATRK